MEMASLVSRSRITFGGKGSGTMTMHGLCRNPQERGRRRVIIALHAYLESPSNCPPATTGVAPACTYCTSLNRARQVGKELGSHLLFY